MGQHISDGENLTKAFFRRYVIAQMCWECAQITCGAEGNVITMQEVKKINIAFFLKQLLESELDFFTPLIGRKIQIT